MRNSGRFLVFALGLAGLAQAGGVVSRCDNASLDAALFGGGTVTITCTGTILSLDNPIRITANTTIIGNKHVTIDGGSVAQIFAVKPGVTLTLLNLNVAHGYAHSEEFPGGFGGAVFNEGTLIATNCSFRDNQADTGGAIYNDPKATLVVNNTLFIGNLAIQFVGGAIANFGDATVTNSTFYGNFVGFAGIGQGRGVGGGAIFTIKTMSLLSSTLAYNGSPGPSSGFGTGGGNLQNGRDLTVTNTIIANAFDGGNCWGGFTNGGGNLIWPGPDIDTSCSGLGAVGDPQLIIPPHNNGGPTETLALASTSPAIETAIDASCPITDQRGIFRPQGRHCDIGAFEYATAFSMASSVLGRVTFAPPQSFSRSSEQVRSTIIEPLSRSLNAGFWQGTDGNHLAPTRGSEVFAIDEQVVNAFNHLITDSAGSLYIQNLLAADRMLATTAVTDAQCSSNPDIGSTTPRCQRATSEIAAGDASAESGDFGQSVVHYANAWRSLALP